jgi:hypothetical protein
MVTIINSTSYSLDVAKTWMGRDKPGLDGADASALTTLEAIKAL